MTKGFPAQEFKTRVAKAQAYMAQQGLDAILLTTEPDVRYFTGYLTQFWESLSSMVFSDPFHRRSNRCYSFNWRCLDGADVDHRHPHMARARFGR
jgi:Xaa-Pro aminopeptidase